MDTIIATTSVNSSVIVVTNQAPNSLESVVTSDIGSSVINVVDNVSGVKQVVTSGSANVVDVITSGTSEVIKTYTAGPQGVSGSVGSVQLMASNYAIGGHRAIAIDSNGNAVYADCTNLGHVLKVVGITMSAFGLGGMISVFNTGIVVESSWNWNVTKPIYFDNNGVLIQAPLSNALFLQVIGTPVTATSMEIKLQPPTIKGN